MAQVAVMLRCTPEQVWVMDPTDLATVIDVLAETQEEVPPWL